MTPRPRKNKAYYAVIEGRLDCPTIFSSWGDVHPRVTGCLSRFRGFLTLEDARKWMAKSKVEKYEEVIKDGAEDTTPDRKDNAFYAVAYGLKVGIHKGWYGQIGAEQEVKDVPGACHMHFKEIAQAETFIQDWNESFSVVCAWEVRKALKRGIQPRDMSLSAEGILGSKVDSTNTSDLADQFSHLGL